MKYPQLEENLRKSQSDLAEATSENIIERCQKYLVLIAKYREELYKFRGTPEVNLQNSSLHPEEVISIRKEIRAAFTNLTLEHNRVESLLKSLTAINGFEAAQIFNSHKYKGYSNWELKAGGLRFQGGAETDRIAIHEAVETASRLRSEEYINKNLLQQQIAID
jgi:hypothetical protein